MTFRIRRSTLSDIDQLGRVHSRAWQETYEGLMPAAMLAVAGSVERRTAIRREIFAATTPNHGHFLVESSQGEIVGFGDCGPAREVKNFAPAEILTLYLLRSAQGRGFGQALMRHMLAHLAQCGFPKAALQVLATNEKALSFYEKLGGVEVQKIQTKIGDVELPEWVYLWHDLSPFAQLAS